MRTNKDKASGKAPFPQYDEQQLDDCTLLFVQTGSHLYGLAHAASDDDYWRVVPDQDFAHAVGEPLFLGRQTKSLQTISGGLDTMVLSDKTFLSMAAGGVPQALEAMFAQDPIIDRLPDFRRAYRAPLTGEMIHRFMSSTHKYAYGNEKKRRYAVRLSLNLREAMITGGRYDPTLNPADLALVKEASASSPAEFVAVLDGINHYAVAPEGWNMAELEASFASAE